MSNFSGRNDGKDVRLYSKLKTGRWPTAARILNLIQFTLDNMTAVEERCTKDFPTLILPKHLERQPQLNMKFDPNSRDGSPNNLIQKEQQNNNNNGIKKNNFWGIFL